MDNRNNKLGNIKQNNKSNNKLNKLKNTIKNNKSFIDKYLKFGVIAFTIIFLVGAYVLFNYNQLKKMATKDHKFLIDSEVILNPEYEKKINLGNFLGSNLNLIEEGKGVGISFEWDMYIPNTISNKGWTSDYNSFKPILLFGDTPQIYYHPRKNFVSFNVKYKEHGHYFQYAQINVEVPLQRWNNYLITINNRTVNIYVNRELKETVEIGNVPLISTSDESIIQIGEKNNNIIGKINNMKIYFRNFTTKDVLNF
jgi:hypothetical protein